MSGGHGKVEAIFHLIDGSAFHAVERTWITDEGPEIVKARGWFESEMPDPWIDLPAPTSLFIQGNAIIWWQEPDQIATSPLQDSEGEL